MTFAYESWFQISLQWVNACLAFPSGEGPSKNLWKLRRWFVCSTSNIIFRRHLPHQLRVTLLATGVLWPEVGHHECRKCWTTGAWPRHDINWFRVLHIQCRTMHVKSVWAGQQRTRRLKCSRCSNRAASRDTAASALVQCIGSKSIIQ